MAPLKIPGYYWDESRNKYFKICGPGGTPAAEPYSGPALKRRRIKEVEKREANRLVGAARNRVGIRLSPASRPGATPLWGGEQATSSRLGSGADAARLDTTAAALLLRELGSDHVDVGAGVAADVAAGAWARSLVEGRGVSFASGVEYGRVPNLSTILVMGANNSAASDGPGAALANTEYSPTQAAYFPQDPALSHDRLFLRPTPSTICSLGEAIQCNGPSCIRMTTDGTVLTFAGNRNDSGRPAVATVRRMTSGPCWRLDIDPPNWSKPEWTWLPSDKATIYGSATVPSSSDLIYAVGTSQGIAIATAADTDRGRWLPTPGSGCGRSSSSGARGLDRSIMDLAFHPVNPAIIYAGGRDGNLWTADRRAPSHQWRVTQHGRAIGRVIPLRGRGGDNSEVLVAGCRSAMAIYDTRFAKPSRDMGPAGRQGHDLPLLRFPGYRNNDHLKFGLDVEPDLGVAAIAHGDGTVGVYSLRSGRRLEAGHVSGIRTDTPIKALMFERMPGEHLPSLFVAVGLDVKKYNLAGAGTCSDD